MRSTAWCRGRSEDRKRVLKARFYQTLMLGGTRELLTMYTVTDGQEILYIVQNFLDGNSTDAALRRLRKDRPDLHARVVQRPASLHAVHNVNSMRPDGTSLNAALRRLRKDRPDLHARVVQRPVSLHAVD